MYSRCKYVGLPLCETPHIRSTCKCPGSLCPSTFLPYRRLVDQLPSLWMFCLIETTRSEISHHNLDSFFNYTLGEFRFLFSLFTLLYSYSINGCSIFKKNWLALSSFRSFQAFYVTTQSTQQTHLMQKLSFDRPRDPDLSIVSASYSIDRNRGYLL